MAFNEECRFAFGCNPSQLGIYLGCVFLAWVNVFGGVQTFTSDVGTEMQCMEVDDFAMYHQIAVKHNVLLQKAWLDERRNAPIRSTLQGAEAQVINESFCSSFNIVLGLVIFLHDAFVPINNRTPYKVLRGRQPHRLPFLEGVPNGDLDVTGHDNLAGVREIAAVAIIEATAKQRLVRDDKRDQVAAIDRSEHQAGDLVDIWYDFFIEDTFGWCGPAQTAIVNEGEGDVIVRFQGDILSPSPGSTYTCAVFSLYVVGHRS